MSITERIMQKRFAPGKGVTGPPPERGVKRFLFLLATYPWKLVTLNLLFIAFSIPIVTMPAALCGMNRVMIIMVREGNCFLWSDFITEFKASLLRSLPFGALYVFLLFESYYALGVSVSGAGGVNVFIAALGLLLLGFAVLFCGYAFVLLPALALKNRHVAKNAFILMVTEWKTNLIILGGTLAMALIMAAFFPYAILLLLFISFAFLQLIVCSAINEPLQRRIIGPYEETQKQGL